MEYALSLRNLTGSVSVAGGSQLACTLNRSFVSTPGSKTCMSTVDPEKILPLHSLVDIEMLAEAAYVDSIYEEAQYNLKNRTPASGFDCIHPSMRPRTPCCPDESRARPPIAVATRTLRLVPHVRADKNPTELRVLGTGACTFPILMTARPLWGSSLTSPRRVAWGQNTRCYVKLHYTPSPTFAHGTKRQTSLTFRRASHKPQSKRSLTMGLW
jgi:hypothetical protein